MYGWDGIAASPTERPAQEPSSSGRPGRLKVTTLTWLGTRCAEAQLQTYHTRLERAQFWWIPTRLGGPRGTLKMTRPCTDPVARRKHVYARILGCIASGPMHNMAHIALAQLRPIACVHFREFMCSYVRHSLARAPAES